jgi:hypothetical protein
LAASFYNTLVIFDCQGVGGEVEAGEEGRLMSCACVKPEGGDGVAGTRSKSDEEVTSESISHFPFSR